MTTETETRVITIDPAILHTVLDQVMVAVASDDSRPVLRGIHVTIDPETGCTFASADGFQLMTVNVPKLRGEPATMLLDASVLKAQIPALKAHVKALRYGTDDQRTVTLSVPGQDGMASTLTIGGSTIAVPVIQGSYPSYAKLIPTLPDGNTGSRIAINGTYIAKIGALANKYADSNILRISTSSPSAPMRLDWHGTDWIATAVVMPMFVKWDAPEAPAPEAPAPEAPARGTYAAARAAVAAYDADPAPAAPASAAPASAPGKYPYVCESCNESAIEDGADRDISGMMCTEFGDDMADHNCDSDESGKPCACTGHAYRE